MTREEIEHIVAGNQMDAAVAKAVMGLVLFTATPDQKAILNGCRVGGPYTVGGQRLPDKTYVDTGERHAWGPIVNEIPHYSTDIAAAWQVVEHLMRQDYRYVLRGNFEGNGLHWCGFDEEGWADLNPLWQSPLCESLPLAICRAALLTTLEV